jgi:hypothetical protein
MTDSKSPRIPPIRKPLDAPVGVRPDAPAVAQRPDRAVLPRARVVGSRHSAITRNLQNYASYKTWAEKMRTNWEPGKDPES